jgi:hypothetical protein
MEGDTLYPNRRDTRFFMGAKFGLWCFFQWKARSNGHPMPAFLAANMEVGKAHLGKGVGWKLTIAALYLLQAQDIGAAIFHKTLNQARAQAN